MMRTFQRSLQSTVATLVVFAYCNVASPGVHGKEHAAASQPARTNEGRPELNEKERFLLERVEQLERRVAELEAIASSLTAKLVLPASPPKLTTVASAPPEAASSATPEVAPTLSVPASSVSPATASARLQEKQAAKTEHKAPFAFGDFTWMNGQNRQKSQPLTNQFGTLNLYLDTYYQVSTNHPRDNTIVGNTSAGRNTEFTVNLMEVGYNTQYKNILGEVSFQIGNMQSLVQDADGSVNRGRNLSTANNKYISEALAGYHFDKWSGINVEGGIFYSYIGLESYLLAENWNYNRSLVSDVTPFYFTGARVQIFPTDKIKIEPWVMNGFQTYGKWNKNSAIGLSNYYRPHEWLAFVASFYYGTDTKDNPDRKRFHHDDSILVRYFNRPGAAGISKMAVSMNNHYGFETGGINPFPGRKAYMAGTSIANRVWFDHDRYAFTVRGEGFTNPTRYLAPAPTASGFPNGPDNYSLKIWGLTGTFDYMPTDFFTLRSEFISRHSNVPFFAGQGGTTSSDGFITTPVGLFVPDVAKHENRVTFAVNFRM
jgi:hypothetical protein